MRKFIFFLYCCVAFAFIGCAHPEPDIFGSITGIVKDAQTSTPLTGVKVTITTTGASQITTSDGQFMFENLDAIEYTLTFEKSGYLTTTQTIRVHAGETATAHVSMQKDELGISVTPAFLDFGSEVSSLSLQLTSTTGSTIQYSASATQSWITITPRSGSVYTNSPVSLTVIVSRNVAPGSYQGEVIIRVNSSSLTIPVSMQVTGASEPVIVVESITEVTQTTATVKGVLTLEDGVSVSDYGVCYSTGNTPTINDSKVSRGGSSRSINFSCKLNGLNAGTEYHVRPYAISNGVTYYGNSQTFTTSQQGGGTDDYSSAKVSSDNPQVEIALMSCQRTSARVTIKATILNKGITPYTNYMIYGNNYGYQIGNQVYLSQVIDDVYTDYGNDAVTKYLNNASNSYNLYTQLPIGATKILTVTIDGVPSNTSVINLYLASVFQDVSPTEYAYLTFENVPIY